MKSYFHEVNYEVISFLHFPRSIFFYEIDLICLEKHINVHVHLFLLLSQGVYKTCFYNSVQNRLKQWPNIKNSAPEVFLNIEDNNLFSNETIYSICTFKEDKMGTVGTNQIF